MVSSALESPAIFPFYSRFFRRIFKTGPVFLKGAGKGYIFINGHGEQLAVLKYNGKPADILFIIILLDIDAIDEYFTLLHII